MTIAAKPMTLEEHLNFNDGTDSRYELVDGQPIAMPTESDLNDRIASFLYAYFLQRGIPHYCLRMKAQIAVSGKRTTACMRHKFIKAIGRSCRHSFPT